MFYDDSVQLKRLDFDLSKLKHYRKKNLSNDEILKQRWKITERGLKLALPLIKEQYSQISDEIVSMIKDLDLGKIRLNQQVSPRIKRLVNQRIKDLGDKGLINGYFKYLVDNIQWIYAYVIEILLYAIYTKAFDEINTISEDVFMISAVDSYSQGVVDKGNNKFKKIGKALIIGLAIMPILMNTYRDYLEGVKQSQVEEIKSFVMTIVANNGEYDETVLRIRTLKQGNRIISIREDKYSGGLDDASRVVANKAYLEDSGDLKDVKVRFVAEMDDRTTKMCESLNNQIFYVNKRNEFIRWSDLNQDYIKVDIFGLVEGINLPPISDHFHWCRSTITYDLEIK